MTVTLRLPRLFHALNANLAGQARRSYRDNGLIWLDAIALIALAGCLLLYLTSGYRAGFVTLNGMASHLPDGFWLVVTSLGDEKLAFALMLPLAYHHPRLIQALFWGALFGLLYTQGIKYALATPRPPAVLDPGAFHLIGAEYHKRAFPSGHTQLAFTLLGVLIAYVSDDIKRRWLLLLAVLIGFSRIAVGVHWPVDVLAGAFGGALSARFGWWLAARRRWCLSATGHMFIVLLMASFPLGMLLRDQPMDGSLHPLGIMAILGCLGLALQTYLFPEKKSALTELRASRA